MARIDDERRLLKFIADRGGPAATINVVGRGAQIGIDEDALPEVVEALRARDLVQILEDGDLRLTPLGRTLTETDTD